MRGVGCVVSLCMLTTLGAQGRADGAEGERTFGKWTVTASPPSVVRAGTQGSIVDRHKLALATASNCNRPLLWISWSAASTDQPPGQPKTERFQEGQPVQVAISAGKTTSRLELPLVLAKPLTPDITVFVLTNVPVPVDLLEALGTADEVQVTIEKPQGLADIPTDSFSLDGFGPAFRDLTEQCRALASAGMCTGADLSLHAWVGLADGAAESRTAYLTNLESCISKKPALGEQVDDAAVDGLEALDTVPKKSRERCAAFISEVLRVNAKAGYASSQHNLAVMHHAPSGSTLAKAFPQDPGRFVYWTRKAAAQGEPRALFNLAARLAQSRPMDGVQPDPATAYLAFLALEPMIGQHESQLGQLRPVVEGAKEDLEERLGKQRVAELKNTSASFQLSSLAPTGPEPALGG